MWMTWRAPVHYAVDDVASTGILCDCPHQAELGEAREEAPVARVVRGAVAIAAPVAVVATVVDAVVVFVDGVGTFFWAVPEEE
jgi:hypothetical protein